MDLPDFRVASNAAHALGGELGKCSNLPQFQQGFQILEAIRTLGVQVQGLHDQMNGMRAQMNGMQDQMNGMQDQMTGMRVDLTSLTRRQLALEHNQNARLGNSLLILPGDALFQLRNQNNDPIPDSPNTVYELLNLRVADLGRILLALNVGIEGNVEQKKIRLRQAFGVKADIA